jgi:hypothetical protein
MLRVQKHFVVPIDRYQKPIEKQVTTCQSSNPTQAFIVGGVYRTQPQQDYNYRRRNHTGRNIFFEPDYTARLAYAFILPDNLHPSKRHDSL